MNTAQRYPSREAWLGARRIGSSDVATLLGVGPTEDDDAKKSPWDVLLRLRGEARRDRPTRDTRRGVTLEPRILRAYAAATGRDVRPTPPHTLWFRDDWASATPDARDELGVVEAKSDRNPWRWGEPTTIERWGHEAAQHVRPDYFLQIAHQMFVLDAPVGHLAVLLPGEDPFLPELRVYRIERDRELEERMVGRLSAWWDAHVVRGELLDLDGSDAASVALAQTAASGSQRQATPEEAALAATYTTARDLAKHWESVRKLAGQHLVEHANGTSRLDLPRGHVTVVRQPGRTTLDERSLLAAHPELAPVLDQHRRTGDATCYPLVKGIGDRT